MSDSDKFFDPIPPEPEDELPILPDEEYAEARRALEGKEVVEAPPPELAAADEEQLLYARILSTGMLVGLLILLLTFAVYVTGLLTPAVPIQELPRLWTLSAHEYLEAIDHEFLHRDALVVGWSWMTVLRKGDFFNFLGVALLSAVTIVCYVGILPTLFRKRDWVYGTIALLEVIILVLAASGLVSAGH